MEAQNYSQDQDIFSVKVKRFQDPLTRQVNKV